MKEMPMNQKEAMEQGRHRAKGVALTSVIAAVCLLLGFGLGGWWRDRSRERSAVGPSSPGGRQDLAALAAGTNAVEVDQTRDRGGDNHTPAVVPGEEAVLAIDPAIVAEVKRLLPNFASVSMEEGTRVLRESALQELKAAVVNDMATQLREAEQRLTRMQETKSEAEKQSALKDLQRVQAKQAAKLSEIAARSSAQIEALRQLKGAYGDRLTR